MIQEFCGIVFSWEISQGLLGHAETPFKYSRETILILRSCVYSCSVRFAITFALCVAYIAAIQIYKRQGVLDENRKRLCNAWTTGISIALGLNIASSFKDLALNMRWPILASRKRNLLEVSISVQNIRKF